MFKYVSLFFILFVSVDGLYAANKNLCVDNKNSNAFEEIQKYLEKNPFQSSTKTEKIQKNQKIKTTENEQQKITFSSPYEVSFYVEPNSEIEIIELANKNCGPKIKLISGSVVSDGKHPKNLNCNFEIETEEAFLEPIGTRYRASTSSALNEALAELNGEDSSDVYSVDEGEIIVKLKKLSSNKAKNKIKYVKESRNKNNKVTKKSVKKSTVAKDEKIKIKAKSKMKVVKKGKQKKDQVADLEVVAPWEN